MPALTKVCDPKLPKAPSGLSAESRKLWDSVVEAFKLEAHHLTILANTLRSLDLLRKAEAALETEGLITQDRFGQKKPHPACVIARDSRSGVLQGFRQLGLDYEAFQAKLGRPCGS